MGEKQTAYLCTTFERLKKFVELVSERDWESLSRTTQMEIVAGFVLHGDQTAVVVEPTGEFSIFEFGARNDVEYAFFVPDNEKN